MTQIAVLPGDGIGPEVIAEALKVLRVLNARFGLDISTVPIDLGAETYLRTGDVLPDSAIDSMAGCDAILLGAFGDPRVAPGILERGVIVALRTRFRQSVNVRPCKLRPGLVSPLRDIGPSECDFTIVRENTEGLYAGSGTSAHTGSRVAVAVHTSITTTSATEVTVRYAFELAQRRGHHLTLCHKTNILVDAGRLWLQAVDAISAEFTDIEVDYAHADAMCLHLLQQPGRYDVIVTDNLFGDILSDLGAAIQGGLGTAASGNLNLDGTAPSMFEPVHGSAPDIAGSGRANPAAAILSLAMLLDHLGHTTAAAACDTAVDAALRKNAEHPSPMPTVAFGDAVVTALSEPGTPGP